MFFWLLLFVVSFFLVNFISCRMKKSDIMSFPTNSVKSCDLVICCELIFLNQHLNWLNLEGKKKIQDIRWTLFFGILYLFIYVVKILY